MGLFSSKQERLNNRLLRACRKGDVDAVQEALLEGAEIECRDKYGNTPLLSAAIEGKPDVLVILLEKGADPNAVNNGNLTAIIYTTANHYRKATEVLVAAPGTDIAVTGEEGQTPLHYASENNNNAALIEALYKRGAKLDARDNKNRTPLHYCAYWGYFDNVKKLTELGADTAARDSRGDTPEDRATGNDKRGVANYLKSLRAEPEPDNGWTLTAADEVACVSAKPQIGYSITELFNFTARTYTRIAHNVKTGAESQSLRFFDEFPDTSLLEKALAEARLLGAKGLPTQVHGIPLPKKSL